MSGCKVFSENHGGGEVLELNYYMSFWMRKACVNRKSMSCNCLLSRFGWCLRLRMRVEMGMELEYLY